MTIKLLELFPEELSSSGDSGNAQVVAYRLQQFGAVVEIVSWSGNKALPTDVSAVFIGNGPWSAALKVLPKIRAIQVQLKAFAEQNIPIFAVGVGAELLSESIRSADGVQHEGLGVFAFDVVREADRRVGYMRISSSNGDLIGFGDFASLWTLRAGAHPLGNAVVGDRPSEVFVEGCTLDNSIATRLGGPALPLNPALASPIVSTVALRHGIMPSTENIEIDVYAENARSLIVKNIDSVFTTIAL